jgi:hypothetical protein
MSVLLRITDSDYPFGIFERLPIVLSLAIVLYVLLQDKASEYPFGIFKLFLYNFVLDNIRHQQSESSWISVLELSILTLSTILLLHIGTIRTAWTILPFNSHCH